MTPHCPACEANAAILRRAEADLAAACRLLAALSTLLRDHAMEDMDRAGLASLFAADVFLATHRAPDGWRGG